VASSVTGAKLPARKGFVWVEVTACSSGGSTILLVTSSHGHRNLVNEKICASLRVVETDPQPASRARPYHHGDLRRALLDAAVEVLAEAGPSALSLRHLARRAGVSHAAPAHHFGDRAGLLTAVAAEGHRLLGEALQAAWERTGEFLEVGVAYVRFAVDHPGHFDVMFTPDLHDEDDPDLRAATAASSALLFGPLRERAPGEDVTSAAVAAWSLVHGLAALWRNGVLPDQLGDDVEAAARSVLRHLYGSQRGLEDC
jgi:AcrR family transcriptional regulator